MQVDTVSPCSAASSSRLSQIVVHNVVTTYPTCRANVVWGFQAILRAFADAAGQGSTVLAVHHEEPYFCTRDSGGCAMPFPFPHILYFPYPFPPHQAGATVESDGLP